MVAVFGDVAEPDLAAVPRAQRRDVFAFEQDRTGVGVFDSDHDVEQLALSVAFHAGDTDDLARMHDDLDPVEDDALAVVKTKAVQL